MIKIQLYTDLSMHMNRIKMKQDFILCSQINQAGDAISGANRSPRKVQQYALGWTVKLKLFLLNLEMGCFRLHREDF
jgi:hypothetical protein